MRAEDLFEAVGGIDERLIARSDRAGSAQKKTSVKKTGKTERRADRKSRRSMGAEIYRFAVIAMATAVAVFLVLMAGDILGIRSLSDLRNIRITRSGIETAQDIPESEDAGVQEKESAGQEAVTKIEADPALESEAQSEANSRQMPQQEQVTEEDAEKAAVDLLGELKGDYVSIEYISAEDEANGKSRTVPQYSEEGEKALAEAFTKGEASPSFLANTGEATYYVYLTKKNGEVHKVTFYEKCYVSMNNVPGVVMKITEEEYQDVMALFH